MALVVDMARVVDMALVVDPSTSRSGAMRSRNRPFQEEYGVMSESNPLSQQARSA